MNLNGFFNNWKFWYQTFFVLNENILIIKTVSKLRKETYSKHANRGKIYKSFSSFIIDESLVVFQMRRISF